MTCVSPCDSVASHVNVTLKNVEETMVGNLLSFASIVRVNVLIRLRSPFRLRVKSI